MRLSLDCGPRRRLTLALGLSTAGGAVFGLFLARLLAESGVASWAWRPLPVAGVAALAALAASAVVLVPALYASAEGRPRPPDDLLVAPLLALFLPVLYLMRADVDLLQARVLLGGTVAAGLLLAAGGATMLPATPARRRLARFATVALLGLPLLVYLQTLSPTIGEADSFEFQVAAKVLGVAHPTGYPLYTLLGRLFIFLPVGDAAYRVNLTSPVFATLAVLFLYLTVARLSGRRAAALVAALAFAFSPTFWSQAVVAEVYALNAFFVALLLYLVVARDPAPATSGWRLPAFLYGLSLTNHLTMVLLAPALAASVLWRRGLNVLGRWRRWPAVVGMALSPLLLYLYIPLRWPALGLGGTLAWITGRRWSGTLRLDSWLHDSERYRIVARFALEEYGRVGVALALAGLLWLLWRRRRAGLSLVVAWVAYAFYALNYLIPDISAFLIPAHLVMAVGIGAATAALLAWLSTRARPLVAPCTLLVALLPLSMAWTHWPVVDHSQAGRGELAWGRYVLGLDIPPDASILADSGKVAPLHYLTAVEGVRRDLETTAMGDEAGYRRGLQERIAAGRPVYLARFVPGLEGAFHLRSLGPLVEVGTVPAMPPAIDYPQDVAFGEGIRLLGLDADGLAVARGDSLHVTLYWRAEAPPQAHYHVRLRLVGSSGHVWWEKSDHPVSGMYPTAAWRVGEVVPDYHQVPIEASLHPGDYRLEVGLFLPFSEEGLPIAGREGPFLPLATVRVLDGMAAGVAPLAIPQAMAASFDGRLLLVGRDVPTVARPGAQLPVTLYWRPAGPCPDYTIAVEALDEGGQVVARAGGPPLYGEYPASRWTPGTTLVTHHRLALPTTAGPLRLQVSVREPGMAGPVPVEPGWLAARRDECPLGTVRVESAPLVGEVGGWPLATMQRLPVLDDELRPVDDRVLIDGLQVTSRM